MIQSVPERLAACRPGSIFILALATFGCVSRRVATVPPVVAPHVATSVSRVAAQQTINAVYAGDGDYEIKVLRTQLETNPRNTAARLALANLYLNKGFPDVAIEHCRLACERAPDSVEAHVALSRMLRAEHMPAEGARVLADFASRHDGEVEVWAWLGLLQDEAGDWKAGEAAHRRAIGLAPSRDDLLNNLGYCLLKQGRKTEAAETFRSALKINPKSAIARDNLGLAEADSPAEAVLDWQSISGPAAAHNNLAASLIETGRYDEARREIQAALDYAPGYEPALNNLRIVSELDGKPTQIAVRQSPPKGWSGRMAARWKRIFTAEESE